MSNDVVVHVTGGISAANLVNLVPCSCDLLFKSQERQTDGGGGKRARVSRVSPHAQRFGTDTEYRGKRERICTLVRKQQQPATNQEHSESRIAGSQHKQTAHHWGGKV